MIWIREYIKYLKDNPHRYWFKRKLFGWGWVPVTWQGWLAIGIYVAVVVFASSRMSSSPTIREIFVFTMLVVFGSFILIGLGYKKGEKPRWQWGLKSIDRNK